jgi:hypothetical protein
MRRTSIAAMAAERDGRSQKQVFVMVVTDVPNARFSVNRAGRSKSGCRWEGTQRILKLTPPTSGLVLAGFLRAFFFLSPPAQGVC